jgi:hypothetical protein
MRFSFRKEAGDQGSGEAETDTMSVLWDAEIQVLGEAAEALERTKAERDRAQDLLFKLLAVSTQIARDNPRGFAGSDRLYWTLIEVATVLDITALPEIER